MQIKLGDQIQKSERIQALIEELVCEVENINRQISGINPEVAEHKAKFESLLSQIGAIRGRPLFYPYIGTGLGRGPYVELEDGSIKLDLINGIGIHLMGHSHSRVMSAALRGALSDIIMQGHLEPNREYVRMSEKLIELASQGSRLKHVWLSTCGTIANENALKMVRQKSSPARMILAFENAFAGRSTMMAEITDNPEYKDGLPNYNEILRLPFFDPKDPAGSSEKTLRILKEHVARHGKNICAFMFEAVQGEGGFKVGTREFFVPLLEFCREQKIPVWIDEIQTFCRTGEFFAFKKIGIGEYVDVCTIAKIAQSAATLYTAELNPKPGLIAGTFASSTVSLEAGLEILKILDEEGYMGAEGKIQKIHQEFVGMLKNLCATSCKGLLQDPNGIGLMIAVTPFDGSKEKTLLLLKALFKNGIICFNCGKNPSRVRFLVPAVITSKDIATIGAILEKSVKEVAQGL